jgi:hypothetical protein
MFTDTSTPTEPKKRTRRPHFGPLYEHLTFPMVNAGPGLTATCVIPELSGGMTRVQVEGVKAEHIERVRLVADGLPLLDVSSYTDEGGERHSAGACLLRMAGFDGLIPSGLVVPLFHVPLHGPSVQPLRPGAPLLVWVELTDAAPWGATVRVIYTPVVLG